MKVVFRKTQWTLLLLLRVRNEIGSLLASLETREGVRIGTVSALALFYPTLGWILLDLRPEG